MQCNFRFILCEMTVQHVVNTVLFCANSFHAPPRFMMIHAGRQTSHICLVFVEFCWLLVIEWCQSLFWELQQRLYA
jgi:hypothetical protein